MKFELPLLLGVLRILKCNKIKKKSIFEIDIKIVQE